MQKIEKFGSSARSSEAIFEKVQFWAKFDLLTPPTGGQEFFSKIVKVTFLHLCYSNFVQNIKNFWLADPEISALRMGKQTDEAEFIGPFRLKSWVQ